MARPRLVLFLLLSVGVLSSSAAIAITGVEQASGFSLTRVELGLLLFAVLTLVFAFRSSAALAYAYGMAVTGTITIVAILFFYYAHRRWRWPLWAVIGGGGFILPDPDFQAFYLGEPGSWERFGVRAAWNAVCGAGT